MHLKSKRRSNHLSETYFQQGANAMLNSPKSFYLASYKVYQSIFEPLKLQPNETITLIPDGIFRLRFL